MRNAGTIRVGVGGWTFQPWRGTFFPAGLPQARELDYAAERLTAIEINGTYYRLQTPSSFAKWAAATPPDFVFTVKASRYCTTRPRLAEAGEGIGRFLAQGIVELGEKLGPILWQFMPARRFDPDDFAAFLELLPRDRAGVPLRHAVEVRHDSFRDAAFVALARKAKVAIVFADSAKYPMLADLAGDFVYARLQNAQDGEAAGYPAAGLDRWAEVARLWSAGLHPDGLPYVAAKTPPKQARDVFVFMINGAKVRAPAAAEALLTRLRAGERR